MGKITEFTIDQNKAHLLIQNECQFTHIASIGETELKGSTTINSQDNALFHNKGRVVNFEDDVPSI